MMEPPRGPVTHTADTAPDLSPPDGPVQAGARFRRVLRRLAREHQARFIQGVLLRSWVAHRGLSRRAVRSSGALSELIGAAEAGRAGPVESVLRPLVPHLDLKALETAFELLRDAGERREQGAVYTPAFVVDDLLTRGLGLLGTRSRGAPLVVCDPACGSGGFLVRAVEVVADRLELRLEEAAERHVVGFDVDRSALRHAAAFVDLLLISRGRPARGRSLRLLAKDTLVSGPAELLREAGVPGGFDLVVANPPYVKLQNLPESYRRDLERRFPALTYGSYALAPLSLAAYLELLAPRGHVAAITQNNLFTSLSGEPVRRLLQDRGALRRIVDFGHQRLFEGASAYTCLLFLGKEPSGAFDFAAVEDASARGLERATFSALRTAELSARKWRLGSPDALEWLRRIETTGVPLGKLARIRVGFATLKDAAFFADAEDAHFCLARGPDGSPVRIEAAATRPALKIAAATSEEEVEGNRRRVIFPYARDGARFRLLSEETLRSSFPLTYRHLHAHRRALDARDKGKRKYQAWYAWGRTQGMDAPGPKLLTRTFDRRPRFFLDPTDQLFCNGYAVFPRDRLDAERRLRVLQALLASRVMHFYVRLTSVQLEGGFQCYQKNFIERFGVPSLDAAQASRMLALSGEQQEAFIAALYGLPAALP